MRIVDGGGVGGVDMSIICCEAESGLVVVRGGEVDGEGGCGSTRVSSASIMRSVEQKFVRFEPLKSLGFDFPVTEQDFD